jgi:hypothetical protein
MSAISNPEPFEETMVCLATTQQISMLAMS